VVHAGTRIIDVQAAGVHGDLARGIELDESAIHRARRGAFEIHSLAVIATAVARAFEFVFRRLPFGRAAQVRALGVDDKNPVGLANDPGTIGHQIALVNAEIEVGRIADAKNRIGLVEGAREEKPQKHQKVDAEIAPDARPNDAAAAG